MRLHNLKSILYSFVTSNIQQIQSTKYLCVLDKQIFSSYKEVIQHIRTHHKHDFEQLIRVLLYGMYYTS